MALLTLATFIDTGTAGRRSPSAAAAALRPAAGLLGLVVTLGGIPLTWHAYPGTARVTQFPS